MTFQIPRQLCRLSANTCRQHAADLGRGTRKAGFATLAPSTPKTPMSRFEQDQYIDYDKLDGNIELVRSR